ncbi:hypothetical protein [Pelagicoccus sp. SDUM812005]|nr:hypothetical protein [Pelagicoccus sp. SDUM812005]MDQ8180797.1 hypothetical protein [Pelagicoccus sp. SDUM812005]
MADMLTGVEKVLQSILVFDSFPFETLLILQIPAHGFFYEVIHAPVSLFG